MRLIDADAFKKWLVENSINEREEEESRQIGIWIDAFPTIEPEQKKGRWNLIITIPDDKYGRHYCSECGKEGNPFWNFCPNCRADMRGDSDEIN